MDYFGKFKTPFDWLFLFFIGTAFANFGELENFNSAACRARLLTPHTLVPASVQQLASIFFVLHVHN